MSSLKRQQGAQARFVSLRLFVRCHKQGRGVEQVTQDSLFNLDADFPYEELEEPQLQRAEVALPCYVGAVVPVPDGGEGQKKECLNLTNKATMSLKIKEDENEQSRTKPIMSAGKPCKTQGHSADLKSLCDKRSTAILAVIGTGKMPVLRAAGGCQQAGAAVFSCPRED